MIIHYLTENQKLTIDYIDNSKKLLSKIYERLKENKTDDFTQDYLELNAFYPNFE